MYYVYMLRCADGSLYTGYTNDVQRRFAVHAAGRGAKYTRSHPPVAVVASWPYATRSEAMRAEARIKRLSKAEKEHLAAGEQLPEPYPNRNELCNPIS